MDQLYGPPLDRRAKFRKGLSVLYLPYYDALCSLLSTEWQPYVGVRSWDEQTRLFKIGRERPGHRVTDAKAGESPHNYGCATDWCLWEKSPSGLLQPIWPPNPEEWAPYQLALEKVGLKWGADWNMNGDYEDECFRDWPHNELPIACSWKAVNLCYQQGGMTAAQQKIEVAHARV